MIQGEQAPSEWRIRPTQRMAGAAGAIAIGLLLVFPPAASAEDAPVDACKNPVSQHELTACAGQEADKAEADMAIALAKARAAMVAADQEFASQEYPDPVSAVEAFESSQRGWLQYREGRCIIAGFAEHLGSMEPMVISECLEAVTRTRIAELNAMAEN